MLEGDCFCFCLKAKTATHLIGVASIICVPLYAAATIYIYISEGLVPMLIVGLMLLMHIVMVTYYIIMTLRVRH